MNRVGVLSIVLAAAVTGACGGADGVSSSPTGPSSTTTTTLVAAAARAAAGGMRAGEPARRQHPGHRRHAAVDGREWRDRVRGSGRLDPQQLGSALDEHDEQQLHLDGEGRPAVRARTGEVRRAVRRLVERSGVHRRQLGQTRRGRRCPDRTGQSVGRSVDCRTSDQEQTQLTLVDRTRVRPRFAVSWPEARNRRRGPEIDVVDALKESFGSQRVKCFGASCVRRATRGDAPEAGSSRFRGGPGTRGGFERVSEPATYMLPK